MPNLFRNALEGCRRRAWRLAQLSASAVARPLGLRAVLAAPPAWLDPEQLRPGPAGRETALLLRGWLAPVHRWRSGCAGALGQLWIIKRPVD